MNEPRRRLFENPFSPFARLRAWLKTLDGNTGFKISGEAEGDVHQLRRE